MEKALFPRLLENLSKYVALFDMVMWFMVIISDANLTFNWRYWLYILCPGLVGLIPYVTEIFVLSKKTRTIISVLTLVTALYPIVWLVVFIVSGIRLFL